MHRHIRAQGYVAIFLHALHAYGIINYCQNSLPVPELLLRESP